MSVINQDLAAWENPGGFELTAAQVRFFRCFGFLKLTGVFSANEMTRIRQGMEEVFARFDEFPENEVMHKKAAPLHQANKVHDNPERYIIGLIAKRSPHLSWLLEDPRIRAIPAALIGDDYQLVGDSGSLFSCETNWHVDSSVGASIHEFNLKLCLYMDPLRRENGALRIIPGTHCWNDAYAGMVRKNVWPPGRPEGKSLEDMLGIAIDEVPAFVLETDPGDLLLWDYRMLHASFYGGTRRFQWSIDFKEPAATPAD